MKRLTKLLNILNRIAEGNGQFGYMTTRTEPKMRKTGNPFVGRVTKIATVQFRLQYYKSVKSIHDGTPLEETTVKPLSWAEHVAPFVIRNKGTGELYFQLKPEKKRSVLLLDGKPANQYELAAIKSFLVADSEGPSWNSVKLTNVIRLNVNRQKFVNKGLQSLEDVLD